MVVGLDILFVVALELPGEWGLWLALGLSGWLYFPLRQRLWRYWVATPRQRLEAHLPELVRAVASAPDAEAMATAWRQLLEHMFRPLHLTPSHDPVEHPRLDADGIAMTVPGLTPGTALNLALPDRGQRLFHPSDPTLAEAALTLARQAFAARRAQDEGMRQERSRITRELHDGLGGTLLAIMHGSEHPEEGALARKAWGELREIMAALEGTPRPLNVAANDWLGDLRVVVTATQARLEVHTDTGGNPLLGPTVQLHARRILAEGVANALRHGGATLIQVGIAVAGQTLHLTVDNDGTAPPPELWSRGRGMHHILRRAQSLGGNAQWHARTPSGARMEAWLPLSHPQESPS